LFYFSSYILSRSKSAWTTCMTRRRHLLSLGLAIAASGFGAAPAALRQPWADGWRELLLSLSADHPTARRLGQRYLATGDDTAPLAATLRRLADHRPSDAGALRAAIAHAVRDDLAVGDTVVVDGWVLARSEAQVLGLLSLC
jgi:hypothetical protein